MRRYTTALVIGGLLALSGFAAALIATTGVGAGTLQTTGTTTVTIPTTTATITTTTTTTTTTRPPRKITICHHARAKNGATKHVTIRISERAWNAHRKHGDTLGACSTAKNKKLHKAKAHVKKFHKKPRRR